MTFVETVKENRVSILAAVSFAASVTIYAVFRLHVDCINLVSC